MKKIITLFIVALFATSALAQDSQRMVAKYSIGGGLTPPDYPYNTEVQLLEDGSIQQVDSYMGGRTETTEIGTLSADIINNVLAEAANLPKTKLVFENPEAPECMDAPSSSAWVLNSNDQLVPLYGSAMCKNMIREDGFYSRVSTFVKGLWFLSTFSK